MRSDRRRIRVISVVLAVGAIVLASPTPPTPAFQASATPHMKAAPRGPRNLQGEVIRLFGRLDGVSRAIQGAETEMAWVLERISSLSRRIDGQQELLNRRAAEAFMGERAVVFDSVLGAGSFTDLQDSLEFLDAISQKDQDVIRSLLDRKVEVERQRFRLEALEEELRRKQLRLEATVAHLVEKLQRQLALLRQRAEENPPEVGSVDDPPASTSPPDLPAPNVAPGRGAVIGFIRHEFASLGSRTRAVAVCVAEAESDLDPLAVNRSTGAAGVFQFLPSTWASLSELAGRGGDSVFDARANVAVAAWAVGEYGWHPWRSVAANCGIEGA